MSAGRRCPCGWPLPLFVEVDVVAEDIETPVVSFACPHCQRVFKSTIAALVSVDDRKVAGDRS